MTDFNTLENLGTIAFNESIFVAGTEKHTQAVFLDAATAGYVPAVGDVLCRKSDDTNKHQKYDHTDAALVILGVIDELKEDNTGTPVVEISFTNECHCHYAALGYTGTQNAAQKLAFIDLMLLKNQTVVD